MQHLIPLAALALLTGCSGQAVVADWTGGSFLVLSGPVASELGVSGDRTRAAVAWAWIADGGLHGQAEEAAFEPRVYQYALTLEHPPVASSQERGAVVPASLQGIGELQLLFGLPILYEPVADGPIELAVSPDRLLDRVLDPSAPLANIVAPVDVSQGTVVAALPEHMVLALAAPPGVERLSSAPDWGSRRPCQLDRVVKGLTLYRRGEDACGSWLPLAAPGERTEFQGVAMGGLDAR